LELVDITSTEYKLNFNDFSIFFHSIRSTWPFIRRRSFRRHDDTTELEKSNYDNESVGGTDVA